MSLVSKIKAGFERVRDQFNAERTARIGKEWVELTFEADSNLWTDTARNWSEATIPGQYPDGKLSFHNALPSEWGVLTGSASGSLVVDRRGIGTRMYLFCHSPLLYLVRYGTGNSSWQAWADDDSPAASLGNLGITSAMTPQQVKNGKISYARVYGTTFPILGENKAGLVETNDLFWKGNARVAQHFYSSTEAYMRTAFSATWGNWNKYVFQGDSFHSAGDLTFVNQDLSDPESGINLGTADARYLRIEPNPYADHASADIDSNLASGSGYTLSNDRAVYRKP